MTCYYLDCEFDDNGKTIELISIGLVCEDGRELYLVSTEFDPEKCNDWVKANVLPQLPKCTCTRMSLPHGKLLTLDGCLWRTRNVIRDMVRDFVIDDGQPVEIWAYFGSYDWVVFCQLFGAMVDLPPHFPKFIRDLKTYALDVGYDGKFKDLLPDSGHHNALQDAKWNRSAHVLLDAIPGIKAAADVIKRREASELLVKHLLDDLTDRSGFDMDNETREMIHGDWVKMVEPDRLLQRDDVAPWMRSITYDPTDESTAVHSVQIVEDWCNGKSEKTPNLYDLAIYIDHHAGHLPVSSEDPYWLRRNVVIELARAVLEGETER